LPFWLLIGSEIVTNMDDNTVLDDQIASREYKVSDAENAEVSSKKEGYISDEKTGRFADDGQDEETDIMQEPGSAESSYVKLRSTLGINEILANSLHYHDITVRCKGDDRSFNVNKIVLAAASPLFRKCLSGEEEGCQIVLADCSYSCLSLVIQYIYSGEVYLEDLEQKQEVEHLCVELQIGEGREKDVPPNEQTQIPLIKSEPEKSDDYPYDEENTVEHFNHFLSNIETDNEVQKNKRKAKCPQKKQSGWEEDVDFKDLFKEEKDKKIKSEKEDIEGEFTCELCNKSYNKKQRFDDHMSKHTGEQLKCKYCPKLFDRPGLRRVHEQLHTKPFKCTECDASFGRKSNLIGHQRIHRGERPYICDLCGSGFPIQSSLLTHKKQSHPEGTKPWFCEYCEHRFVSKSQLEIHRRVHTGEKPWICDTCGRGFTTKQNMLDHTRLHNDKMDYCCNKCGQQFKWKQSLERHLMDHTGVRPHPCEQCKLTFKTSNSLKKHKLSVHSDIKHFACQHCGSRFSTSSGVLRHQKKQRCSAMKQGIGDTAIKTETLPSQKAPPEILQYVGNQGKQETPMEIQDNSKLYQSSQIKLTDETQPTKQRPEILHYTGSTSQKIRPELLQYLGTAVKQEQTIPDSGDSSDPRFREADSVRVNPSIQSIQYLQNIQSHGQPLALTLPRHHLVMETEAADRQGSSSSIGQPHINYRLHIPE